MQPVFAVTLNKGSLPALMPVASVDTQLPPLVKISVSKDTPWEPVVYAKAPLELLLCDDLTPNSKLLWIVLANQVQFGPICRTVLDRRIGIHRATRIRCMADLKELGLVSGTPEHIILHDPVPILRRLREVDAESRAIVEQQMLQPYEEVKKKVAPPKAQANYFDEATNAWNEYRPVNYAKINRLSAQLLKAVDLHIKALGHKSHDYKGFFSVLKAGVDHSIFWSKENTSKTLQSIVGIGQPQTKKYQNVYSLYNEGLNYEKPQAVKEEDRSDEVIIKAAMRRTIDEYENLHYMYFNTSRTDPGKEHVFNDRIIETEQRIRDAGLDPARFRMKYQLTSWPTDVPEPADSRKVTWIYDDEL